MMVHDTTGRAGKGARVDEFAKRSPAHLNTAAIAS
jgi:hypothetical protein